MKIYVIGPVTGLPDRNVEAFQYAAVRLTRAGYEVEIPHYRIPKEYGWAQAMLTSVRNMLACDGVALLEGWEHSQGACIERGVCLDIGVPHVKTVEEWVECSR